MIDVLIPVFNAEATVSEAVSSILKQTIRDLNVVVIDDGSTDATPNILRDLARADERITLVRKENGGIVDALNLGLKHCTAEIVARHDADDIAYPDRLAAQVAYLRANSDCIAVGANAWHIDVRGRCMGRTWLKGEPPADWDAIPSIEPYIMHPFLMMRRWAIQEAGVYRHVYNAEDTDLYWRLRELGRLHNLEDVLGEYRIHSNSVTSGSAVSARINAVTAQLGAISARRRAAGQADLSFSPRTLTRYRAGATFPAILAIAAEQLTSSEAEYLRLAAAAKLIELRNYRPFRLSINDIATVGSTFRRSWTEMSQADRWAVIDRVRHALRPKFGIKRMLARLSHRSVRQDPVR